jgi:hypothetical protein
MCQNNNLQYISLHMLYPCYILVSLSFPNIKNTILYNFQSAYGGGYDPSLYTPLIYWYLYMSMNNNNNMCDYSVDLSPRSVVMTWKCVPVIGVVVSLNYKIPVLLGRLNRQYFTSVNNVRDMKLFYYSCCYRERIRVQMAWLYRTNHLIRIYNLRPVLWSNGWSISNVVD